MNAQHLKTSPDWGTPANIVELAREVMGSIDCDPCTSEYWQTHVVKASNTWLDEEDDALSCSAWPGKDRNWFVNPPGGKVKEFWRLAGERWQNGCAVFWVGFSLEQLLYLQRDGVLARGISRALPEQRIAFLQSPRAALDKLEARQLRAGNDGDDEQVAKLGKAIRRFLDQHDLDGPPVPGEQPTHGCYLALLPNDRKQVDRFKRLVRKLPAGVF